MAGGRLTKKKIDALKPGQTVWDTDVRGFGVRCRKSGGRFYVLKYRANGRQRWFTVGRHGSPWTVETARKEAQRLLGQVAGGIDPAEQLAEAKSDLSISELCDLYVKEGCATKSPTTLANDRGRIERHIKPLLGRKRVKALRKADVQRFMQDVAAGKTATDIRTGPRGRAIVKGGEGTASKAVSLLGAIFTFAVNTGLRSDNPVHGVKTFKAKKFERFLSPAELARLGGVLSAAEADGENPYAIAALRLLALTGCRRSEILRLRWPEVDFEHGCLRLPDSKTGARVITLGAPALELLAELPRQEGNPHVIPGHKEGQHFVGLAKVWQRIRRRAGLENCRLHDLRHSYASVGAASGDSLLIIGKLLGHARPSTTQRYSHLSDDPLRSAANRISQQIATAMDGDNEANVVAIDGKSRA